MAFVKTQVAVRENCLQMMSLLVTSLVTHISITDISQKSTVEKVVQFWVLVSNLIPCVEL